MRLMPVESARFQWKSSRSAPCLGGIPLGFQAVLAGFATGIAGLAASPLAGFPRLMARPTPPALDARKRRSYQNQRNQQELHGGSFQCIYSRKRIWLRRRGKILPGGRCLAHLGRLACLFSIAWSGERNAKEGVYENRNAYCHGFSADPDSRSPSTAEFVASHCRPHEADCAPNRA
jgi:hypothetical protein